MLNEMADGRHDQNESLFVWVGRTQISISDVQEVARVGVEQREEQLSVEQQSVE